MIRRVLRGFRHWLFPHHSNNFRSRLLHNSGYLAVIGLFLALNLFVRILDSTPLHILGFTSSITIDEVVRLTNEQRLAQGLPALKYNERLADAARRKAANMFEENYWSHYSPSGKDPWTWFNAAGYKYTHAGENLAKDFGSSDRMISAWMDSATHRANIVNAKFQEIGVAVVPGTLQGQETMLVVQLFGSTAGGSVPAAAVTPPVSEVKGTTLSTPVPTPAVQVAEVPQTPPVLELKEFATPAPSVLPELPKYNAFSVKKLAALATTALFILVLLADVVFVESRNISRRVGKNWAHIIFINVILILVTLVNAGNIL